MTHREIAKIKKFTGSRLFRKSRELVNLSTSRASPGLSAGAAAAAVRFDLSALSVADGFGSRLRWPGVL